MWNHLNSIVVGLSGHKVFVIVALDEIKQYNNSV